MELIRLQELMASQPQTETETLNEATAYKDFQGIMSVVDDCLADLKDKIGKGGNLSALMKSSGAAKLDTVKDADGKNVLKQMVDLTTEYVKAIQKLSTEAEILISQVNEGQEHDADVLTESKDYSDSSEFTDEFYGIMQQVSKMKQAMKNPRWMHWMKITDTNFGTECEAPARGAIQAVNSLDANLAEIDEELDKAS